MKKKLIIVVIFIFIFGIGAFIISMFPQLPDKPNKERLIDFFNNNSNLFSKIATYLDSSNELIDIDTRRGKDLSTMTEMVTKDGRKPFVISDEVRDEVETLLYRYGFVGISEDEKYIFFYKTWGFNGIKRLFIQNRTKSRF
ncbi:MAG: hypothetical protein GX660_15030 [Clostridiaceae bacterium]|nr:hypothetical protein [Clostridiaceae bacterium]